jgi:murein DD-endopeptidase MepM/ murein hydrolase activator NlpD
MYDHQPLQVLRLLVIALAVFGVVWLFFAGRNPQETATLSRWSGNPFAAAQTQGNAAGVSAAAGLSGAAQPQASGRGQPNDLRPYGNPLGVRNTVMTQGYGVGTHAPAATWGAIDLAIDSTGDGYADPQGSWDHPIYATHSGTVRVTPDSYPAGNHVWVTNESYRTGYAHLASFAVRSGQTVQRGDLIGYVGSTGMSSGPHLDYQVWEMRGGSWVNVNPLHYGALDGTGR